MLKRLLFTLAMLAIVAVCPWITTLVLTVGKLATFVVLASLAGTLWVAGVANVLERN